MSRAGPLPGLQWAPSRRKAYALMAFGVVVGTLCTRATLQAVHTEGQVVSLAKELVQQEQQVLFGLSCSFPVAFFPFARFHVTWKVNKFAIHKQRLKPRSRPGRRW